MSGTTQGPTFRGLDLLLRPSHVEAALWRAYVEEPAGEARQKLFDHYRRFADRLSAAQFRQRKRGNFDFADVRQFSYEALLQAIERFEPYRGVPFEAYARARITGHIRNGLSKASEAAAHYAYRARAERERLRSIQEDIQQHADDPLALLAQLSANIALGLLLEGGTTEEIEAVADPAPSAYESLAFDQLRQKVREAMDLLPPREAYVIAQHYRLGISFQQIAAVLGLSKGRVSQIHRAALERLRGMLAKIC